MQRRAARWRAAGFVAWICALPSPAPAISEVPPEREAEVWAPALAAWGARAAAPGSQARPAPILEAGALGPTLVSVGQEAAGAVVDQPAPTRDETQRWVPGFAFHSGLLGQKAEGSVDSNSTVTYEYVVRERPNTNPVNPVGRLVVTRSLREGKTNYFSFRAGQPTALSPGTSPANAGPSTPPNPPAGSSPAPGCATCTGGIVLPETGKNHLLSPFVGLATEIMTPGLQEVPGRPRLFLHSDAALAFSQVRSVGREGVPDGASFPPPGETELPIEAEVNGIGSITTAEVKTLLVSGGLGVAFTVDAWERRLRIKPSFEYMREKIEVTGKLIRAFRQDTGRTGPPLIPSVFLPTIELESKDELTSYGIGPGLELEMDAGRAGPIMFSVFVSGQAYRMLGDRDVNLQQTEQIQVPDENPTTPAVQDVSAEWTFHKHAWSYRGGLGVRFRWLPEGR
jgi:hypothetical protein